MATVSIVYSSVFPISINCALLSTDSNLLQGRESSEIDNATPGYVDATVQGIVYTGTSPTANTTIAVYAWGSDTPASTTNLDVIDGADTSETINNAGQRNSFLKLAHAVGVTATTSNFGYVVPPFSIAQLFGGVMPRYWGLFITHNTGSDLYNNSVNTNAFKYVGIKYNVA